MVTAIAGAGTSEATWRAWPEPSGWPELALHPSPARVVVAAPHPDDELLGVGGLLTLLAARGSAVHIVAVTDGEASHPGSPTMSPTDLAARRVCERDAALRRLELPASVSRLGLPDGAVAEWEQTLAAKLTATLTDGDWCLATWSGDGHPDHEAVGRAATAASRAAGARLVEFPVWTWHWASPGDRRVPWTRARRIPLPPRVAQAKRRAAAEYRSQVQPLSPAAEDAAILPPSALARLLRDSETVFA